MLAPATRFGILALLAGAPLGCVAKAPPVEPSAEASPPERVEEPAAADAWGTIDQAAIETARACGWERIERYEAQPEGEREESLLLEAAECFEDGGALGGAVGSVERLLADHPDDSRDADLRTRLSWLDHRITDAEGAWDTPLGRPCLGGIERDALERWTVDELDAAATCLQKYSFFRSAMMLRGEISRRLGDEEGWQPNAKRITELGGLLRGYQEHRDAWNERNPPNRREKPAPPPVEVVVPDPPALPLSGTIPAFAKLGFHPDRQKLRATVIGITSAYTPMSLSSLDFESSPWSFRMTVPVLDADDAGRPRRPRVLCDDGSSRVGLALDEGSFEVVVRESTTISPTPEIIRRVDSKTPGVRLAAGAEVVQLSDPTDGTTKIRYEGYSFVTTGFLPADLVDLVFTPMPLKDDNVRNGRLQEGAKFLDAPHGEEIARVRRVEHDTSALEIRTLGPTKDDHILVRYRESEAFVVGWVPADAVERHKKETVRWGRATGSGFGGSSTNTIDLPRGTRLVAPGSFEVVGVVTRKGTYRCGTTCNQDIPWVRMRACGHPIAVFAVPPDR